MTQPAGALSGGDRYRRWMPAALRPRVRRRWHAPRAVPVPGAGSAQAPRTGAACWAPPTVHPVSVAAARVTVAVRPWPRWGDRPEPVAEPRSSSSGSVRQRRVRAGRTRPPTMSSGSSRVAVAGSVPSRGRRPAPRPIPLGGEDPLQPQEPGRRPSAVAGSQSRLHPGPARAGGRSSQSSNTSPRYTCRRPGGTSRISRSPQP